MSRKQLSQAEIHARPLFCTLVDFVGLLSFDRSSEIVLRKKSVAPSGKRIAFPVLAASITELGPGCLTREESFVLVYLHLSRRLHNDAQSATALKAVNDFPEISCSVFECCSNYSLTWCGSSRSNSSPFSVQVLRLLLVSPWFQLEEAITNWVITHI